MSNYQQLTQKELRNYIKQHPEDEEAFQYFLTNIRAKPGIVVNTEEQAMAEFRKRLESESTH
ncbi:hypothetical protein NIES4071_02990 [Calothrix sp. NIES-4071]|nr:hypothetical protein NIES4071_02990 [Calothrix sp. NIES-4071]BAZ54645.1 hypothetical protein NIES4105_02980 [Calothrix sp. NIES-4105]